MPNKLFKILNYYLLIGAYCIKFLKLIVFIIYRKLQGLLKKIPKWYLVQRQFCPRKCNKEVYKLEIINAYITIKTQNLAYRLEDRKELKMHINELLELKVIKDSTSRHTSPAFIVNNYSE